MSVAGIYLTTWEEFLRLPDDGNGSHLELHDGEVITVAPPKPIHIYLQSLLTQWLTEQAKGQGRAVQEFPYRPAANLQFWYADVAFIPNEDWAIMRADEYPIYAPPLIVEVLSPSNNAAKINRQRLAAFSCGAKEFWVVDPEQKQIEVSQPGAMPRVYRVDEQVPVAVLAGVSLAVSSLFE